MPNESLEVVRHGLLRIVVPDLDEVILPTSQHITAIVRQICAGDSTFVDSVQFTDVGPVESCQTVNSNALIFCHHD